MKTIIKSMLVVGFLLIGAQDAQAHFFSGWFSKNSTANNNVAQKEAVSGKRSFFSFFPLANIFALWKIRAERDQLKQQLNEQHETEGQQSLKIAKLATEQIENLRRELTYEKQLNVAFKNRLEQLNHQDETIYYPEHKDQNAIQWHKQGKLSPWSRPVVVYEPSIRYPEHKEQNAIKLHNEGRFVSRLPFVKNN